MSSARKSHNRPSTLADVGREAGVSAMAASAVLNGARTSTRISPETRVRIIEAARKLAYRPNAAARALAQRRMNTVGVAAIINDGVEFDHYFLEAFNGIITSAATHNQTTTVFALHDWHRDAHRLPGFCDGRVDGIILIAPVFDAEPARFLPTHTPFVALHANNPLPGVVCVESDELPGAQAAVSELIAAGHRRILHITGTRGLTGSEKRILGYKHALTQHGIPFDPDLLIDSRYSLEAGRQSLRAWLQRHSGKPLPDAIFAGSDAIALGCMDVLSRAHFSVPRDISVIGFDDTLAARTTVPQLTTIRQPLRAMGMRAVDLLLERIRQNRESSQAVAAETVVFPVEVVKRHSVAPPLAPRPVIRHLD
ncbi:MAG: LacI family DNA-binding transcriptional regulator [Opitutaceae bacterium]